MCRAGQPVRSLPREHAQHDNERGGQRRGAPVAACHVGAALSAAEPALRGRLRPPHKSASRRSVAASGRHGERHACSLARSPHLLAWSFVSACAGRRGRAPARCRRAHCSGACSPAVLHQDETGRESAHMHSTTNIHPPSLNPRGLASRSLLSSPSIPDPGSGAQRATAACYPRAGDGPPSPHTSCAA